MKSLVKMVIDVMWQYAMRVFDEATIKEIVKEVVTEWCEKHLTAEEITSEGKDFVKWLKERF